MIEDLEELKQLIIYNLDVTEFLDLLGMDIADLVELLDEQIEENADKLRKAVV